MNSAVDYVVSVEHIISLFWLATKLHTASNMPDQPLVASQGPVMDPSFNGICYVTGYDPACSGQVVRPRSIRRNCTTRAGPALPRGLCQVSRGVLDSRRKCLSLAPVVWVR
jgi:hypothetical protein